MTCIPQHQQFLERSEGPPCFGFVRLAGIIAPHGPIPISRSTWWEGVRTGRFPKPVKIGPRTTAWRREDINALVEHIGRTV